MAQYIQPSQSPRMLIRRRAFVAAELHAMTPDQKEQLKLSISQADQKARADEMPLAAAAKQTADQAANKGPANESEVKEGETLNEQLQKISKRWGFDK